MHAFSLPVELDAVTLVNRPVSVGYGLPFKHRRPAIAPRLGSSSLAPAVGLYATPEIMCRLVSSLSKGNETLLSLKSKREMLRTQTAVKDGYYEGAEFGLGIMVDNVGKRRVVGHDGHVGGHVTATFFDPEDNIAVSVCANAKGAPITMMVHGIFGALDFFRTAPPLASAFEVRLMNKLSTIQIVQRGETLVAIDPDDWEPFSWYETLRPTNKTSFLITTPRSIYNQGESLQYTLKNGKVTKARFAGMTLYPEKLLPKK